jgi:fumarate reductase flavoprotein subunit
MPNDFDVVIVGSGAAGMAAAVTAAAAGASVLVAEAGDVVGGTSRLSSGMLMGAGTRFQAAQGIEDSPDTLLREYLQMNQWDVDAGLARVLAHGCGPAIEWVADMGLAFHATLSYGGEESRPRTHFPVELGAGLIETLRQEAVEHDVEIALGRRVNRLVVEDGRVAGVGVGDDELRAGAVIVTTGGFGANFDKVAEHYPNAMTAGDWLWYLGYGGAQGDALDLGAQVDAQVTGHGRGLRFMSPNFVREYEATLPGWMMVIDADGHRFCDETSAYGVMERLVQLHGARCYVIFDEQSRLGAPAGKPAHYRQSNPSMPGRRSPNWTDEMIATMTDKGVMHRADSVGAIADALGLPSEVVVGSVERYNGLVAAGEDTDFLKGSEFLRPIATAPFYGAELRLATIAMTGTGFRIDPQARVLDRVNRVIPGLFAAGECVGRVLGDIYIGSGNSLSSCLVFGRVAGREAAALAAGGAS